METAITFGENPILWVVSQFLSAFPNAYSALSQPNLWLDWISWEKTTEDKQSLMRFIYYGASIELFFALSVTLVFYTALAIFYRPLMWKTVSALETLANTTGRFFAWAGLIMVLIQIVIIFIQRIFAVSEITIGFGLAFSFDVSWWSES
ncbi:MAG: C4-dicarboxylate ABC transporter permease, partial [Paracoccaceae bacterium]|nr:C4-dicarboxylate ABC transporter permease [Paracoccaceae bacterium]